MESNHIQPGIWNHCAITIDSHDFATTHINGAIADASLLKLELNIRQMGNNVVKLTTGYVAWR